ncbi:MAG: hypothetical protein IH987_13870 [Planctomycetes bacterium]|nr:hypothetical protein [Planctomycetota bacterium]
MNGHSRREFLVDVGRGMMIAGVGATLASELGISTVFAGESNTDLSFGPMEPLAALMQETSVDRLQSILVEKLRTGTPLRTLVAAGALANARTFGGQDYDGYHTLMALMPAYEMSKLLPADRRALPVLKVLYRNTSFIQREGGRRSEVLHPVENVESVTEANGKLLQQCLRGRDMDGAERIFAKLAGEDLKNAYNQLQYMVQEEIDVHQVVLAWRAWEILEITGLQNAHTMLRQSVRHCVHRENGRVSRGRPVPKIRTVLPQTLDRHKLLSRPLGTRSADDAWIDEFSDVIFSSSREEAADAVGSALAEGFSPEVVGEAISLAANRLLLQDPGRQSDDDKEKPRGSVHGASIGVHASDSANAWRHIARVTNHRNTVASLVVAGFHTAGREHRVSDRMFHKTDQMEPIRITDAKALLRETEESIRSKDQARVCVLVDRYGSLDHSPKPVFDLLLKYAVSEDGALHAEKYYRTVVEEFALTRPAFRWRHLIALARVTASEYGHPAPGRDEARRLLGVS